MLGRLDGRLLHSPAQDIWLARARLRGASTIAGLAGVPVSVKQLQDWICGRTPPPRHSEGLNDPLSVAALFHFAASAGESKRDPVAQATLNLARTLLDDRAEAALWGEDDLLRFGPVWRDAQARLSAPYPAASLVHVAERLIDAQRAASAPVAPALVVTAFDGRQLHIDPRTANLGWITACHLPRAWQAAGMTVHALPNLTFLPRFLPEDPLDLADYLGRAIVREAQHGLADLDLLEAAVRRLPKDQAWTRRSKAPLLMRMELSYPGLRLPAIARLLGISHQGATKLAAQVRQAMDMASD
ncbi:MAG: hypothetical protein PSY12_16625 [bacterium]|nr:hypothetical protein [bacterium]